MKKLLFLLLLCPVFSLAQEEWVYAGEDSDKSTYYIKDATKKSYSDDVVFWVKIIEADKIVKTKKGSINRKGGTIMQQLKVDCKDKTVEITANTVYNSAGKVVSSSRGSFIPEPVVPDSIGESLLLLGCKLVN